MKVKELVTKDDLQKLKEEIICYLNELFNGQATTEKKWLRSNEVMKMLELSASGLQNLRINRKIPFTKLSGTIYYKRSDIEKILENNMVSYSQVVSKI